MSASFPKTELQQLLELFCENRLSPEQTQRLEEIVRADPGAMVAYLDYVDLHGTLTWDTAARSVQATESGLSANRPSPAAESTARSRTPRLVFSVAAVMCAVVIIALAVRPGPQPENNEVVENRERTERSPDGPAERSLAPLQLPDSVPPPRREPDIPNIAMPDPVPAPVRAMADQEIVARIDRLLAESWEASGVTPSKTATRATVTRRLFLDVIGRIPSVTELAQSERTGSRGTDPRADLVDDLLDRPAFARFWSANWTNLLIGRSADPGVNRGALEKFLRDRFAGNEPWNETVAELIGAEGTTHENGAVNFLVAHLNNQAVPATAVTARCFLGLQVQCTQCHDHPFDNSLSQDQFWTLNSFFKQTRRERLPGRNGWALVSTSGGGPTHYETNKGLMKTAYPEFGGHSIDPGANVNRRRELAEIVARQDNRQLSRAMVNRVWHHFFGFGFTSPIDDMGPHNSPTHPELLELLADQFRAHDFDLRKLISWVVRSQAYGLDSRFAKNTIDDPVRGESPLFSRMYVRTMQPEQLYDSLIVVSHPDRHQPSRPARGFDWATAASRRHSWIQQFLFSHNTEENDESSTFNGTVTQALTMMNSELIRDAVADQRGSLLDEIVAESKSSVDQLRAICRAVLARDPSASELAAFRRLLRRERTAAGRRRVLQDALWAYLNSNEFILIH